MQLNHDDIQEFKNIYRQEFGVELSDAEAERRARQLLTFHEAIFQVLLRSRTSASCESSAVDSTGDNGILDDVSPQSGSTSHTVRVNQSANALPSQTGSHPPLSP